MVTGCQAGFFKDRGPRLDCETGSSVTIFLELQKNSPKRSNVNVKI